VKNILSLIPAAIVLLASAPVQAEDFEYNVNFKVVNNSSRRVSRVCVSHTDYDRNLCIRNSGVPANGYQKEFTYSYNAPYENRCLFDASVLLSNGQKLHWSDVDLCRNNLTVLDN
jgi:hypothetical protein